MYAVQHAVPATRYPVPPPPDPLPSTLNLRPSPLPLPPGLSPLSPGRLPLPCLPAPPRVPQVGNRWRSRLTRGRTQLVVGYFSSAYEAAMAYDR